MSLVIAYPGTVGSFSYGAAKSVFQNAELLGFESFEETAQALTEWKVDYALLPVENSSAGAVVRTYALLEKLPVYIVGEVMKTVRHQLLGVQGARLEDIRIIWETIGKVLKRENTSTEGMDTSEDYGDYLLRKGKIDRKSYQEKQQEAIELLREREA